MQPTAVWWKVTIEDIRAANEERRDACRDAWYRFTELVPYRRSELERLKRVAMANLTRGQFVVADFEALVSGYAEQYGRRYILDEPVGWLPEVVKPEELLLFRGIPALAVAAAFAHAICTDQPISHVRRPRGRPSWRAFRCWVGLLAEAWYDQFLYSPTVTHDTDDHRGTESERFGRFPESVERWAEWALCEFAPAEIWWPLTKTARAHMIDAVFKELRGCRKPIKGGPFGGYQEIKIPRKRPMIAEQPRGAESDCPLCQMLHIDRCGRSAVAGSHAG